MAAIYRDFSPADLQPLLASHGITATILVQAAPTIAETKFLLDLASSTPFVAGVVGWAALDAPDAATRVAKLAESELLVGLRPMLHDLPDEEWVLRPELEPALREMKAQGIVFDALVRSQHLKHLLVFAQRHPDLSIVIDHGAKPDLRGSWQADWAAALASLAKLPLVTCKLSGFLTEADPGAGADLLRPYVMHLIDIFGPDRLMWGSDWPVLNLSDSYARWRRLTEALLEPLSHQAQAAVLGGTAERIYLSKRGRKVLPC
jgi:L-fuconolactonase